MMLALLLVPGLSLRAQPLRARPSFPLRAPRTGPICLSVNETLTMGDALLGSLNRQLNSLDKDEQAERDSRNLDSIMAAGTAELDAIKDSLDRDLHWAGLNTSLALAHSMRLTGKMTDQVFTHTEAALESVLVPSRESVRSELKRI